MRNILCRAGREALQQFAGSNTLLGFDFDGTLAPIVPAPERAVLRDDTRRLLEAVARRYPCVVISGRVRRDASLRLQGIAVRQVLGNHGLEPEFATPDLAKRVGRWAALLRKRLTGLTGVMIEDKVYSLAIHYRLSRGKKVARDAIVAAANTLGPVRLIEGKAVVNVLPPGAPHKGLAFEAERTRLKCNTGVYVGDDTTDEDVFALDQPGQLITIRVGRSHATAASYFIDSQRRIADLLQILLDLRPSGRASSRNGGSSEDEFPTTRRPWPPPLRTLRDLDIMRVMLAPGLAVREIEGDGDEPGAHAPATPWASDS